jgi:catechol 2,3-dioxygenase-like lactoylglutathione lyase family enzyme
MSHIRRFDHVGITVADLDTATAFFVGLGLEVEGRTFVEGEFLDTVCGIPDSRTEIVMLRPPDGGTRLELSSFVRPDHEPGSPAAMANELGLRNVAFEVDDLQAAVDRLAHGLRARTRGDHRVPGRADRLTPPSSTPARARWYSSAAPKAVASRVYCSCVIGAPAQHVSAPAATCSTFSRLSLSDPSRDSCRAEMSGGRGRRWTVLARPPRVPAQARLERAAPLHNGRMGQAGQPHAPRLRPRPSGHHPRRRVRFWQQAAGCRVIDRCAP